MRHSITFTLLMQLVISPVAFSGAVDLPVEKKPSIFVNIDYARPARAAILAGTERIQIPITQPSVANLGNTTEENTIAIGVGFWLPCYEWNDFQFNATASIQHIPSRSVTATVPGYDSGPSGFIEPSTFTIKSQLLNFAMGINAIKTFDEQWFMLLGLAGGITQNHLRGEMQSHEDTGITSIGADHPGVSSTYPFVTGEIGFGKMLSNKTKAYIHLQYTHARTGDNIVLAQSNDDNGRIVVDLPEHWYKVGLTLTREINI